MKLFFLLLFFSESHTQIISGGGSGPSPKPTSDWVQVEFVISETAFSSPPKTHWWEGVEKPMPESDVDILNISQILLNNGMIENPVVDYENYINDLIRSEIMPDDDVNIYADYFNSKKENLGIEFVETLYNHWRFDSEVPSNFTRYQYDSGQGWPSQEGLDWGRVEDDVDKAIREWMDDLTGGG